MRPPDQVGHRDVKLRMYGVSLFVVTAFVEMGTGVLLLFIPAVPLALLLGVREAAPEALLVALVAGVAVLAIGAASWLARNGEQSAADLGLLVGILIYDIGAAALLAFEGVGLGMAGLGLWPAVVIHAALAVWCLLNLRSRWPGGGK